MVRLRKLTNLDGPSMTSKLACSIDLGGGTARASVSSKDKEIAFASIESAGVPVLTNREADLMIGVVQSLLRQLAIPGNTTFSEITIAMSGWTPDRAVNSLIARAISKLTLCPAIYIGSDALAAYLGAHGITRGLTINAGTGVVAIGWDGNDIFRADGWGDILGDAGGGYDIGRRTLQASLASRDGRTRKSLLETEVAAAVGNLEQLPSLVASARNPRAFIASFTRLSATAARSGDQAAKSIWEYAVSSLANTALAVAISLQSRLGQSKIRYTGGLFTVEDLIATPFREKMLAHSDIVTSCTHAQTPPLGGGKLFPVACRLPGLRTMIHAFEKDTP